MREITDVVISSYAHHQGSSVRQAGAFIDYFKVYTTDLVIAYSFLMSEYDDSSDYHNAVSDYKWSFTIDFSNDRDIYRNRLHNRTELTVYISIDTFMEGGDFNPDKGVIDRIEQLDSDNQIDHYFWYGEDIKQFIHSMYDTLAKNIVKTAVLSTLPNLFDEDYEGFGSLGKFRFGFGEPPKFLSLSLHWLTLSNGESEFHEQ